MPILTEDTALRRAPAWLRAVYEHVVFWPAVACFVAFCLSLSFVYLLARLILPTKRRAAFGRRYMSSFFRAYFEALEATRVARFDLRALDALRDAPPTVIVANHPALWDALLVAARLPNVVVIMKADVRLNPVFGGGALLAGYVRADRPLAMLHAMQEELASGNHVLIFPESTRTVQVPINPFKGNFALIAKQSQAPIQTIFIETNSRFLSKGWPLWKKPPMPVHFDIRLGKRFACDDDVKRQLREVEAYFRTELIGGRGPRR
jgi:1-acyl-sn-glycerol-3-phosphate acyltransferase